MSARAYDSCTREDGVLTFLADLPKFAIVGRNFDEVEAAKCLFQYDPAYLQGWRDFEAVTKAALADPAMFAGGWPEFDGEMIRRFPDQYPRFRGDIRGSMAESRGEAAGFRSYLDHLTRAIGFTMTYVSFGVPREAASATDRHEALEQSLRQAREKRLPPGRYRFDCGNRDEPTANQKRLFDRLDADQGPIARAVAEALSVDFQHWLGHADRADPRERVVFSDGDAAVVGPDRYRFVAIHLDPEADRVGLELESLMDWHDEHGCGILIKDGQVGECGGGDELSPSDEDEEDDEEDDDEE